MGFAPLFSGLPLLKSQDYSKEALKMARHTSLTGLVALQTVRTAAMLVRVSTCEFSKARVK